MLANEGSLSVQSFDATTVEENWIKMAEESNRARGLVAAHVLLNQLHETLAEDTLYILTDPYSLSEAKTKAWGALRNSSGIIEKNQDDYIVGYGDDLRSLTDLAISALRREAFSATDCAQSTNLKAAALILSEIRASTQCECPLDIVAIEDGLSSKDLWPSKDCVNDAYAILPEVMKAAQDAAIAHQTQADKTAAVISETCA